MASLQAEPGVFPGRAAPEGYPLKIPMETTYNLCRGWLVAEMALALEWGLGGMEQWRCFEPQRQVRPHRPPFAPLALTGTGATF